MEEQDMKSAKFKRNQPNNWNKGYYTGELRAPWPLLLPCIQALWKGVTKAGGGGVSLCMFIKFVNNNTLKATAFLVPPPPPHTDKPVVDCHGEMAGGGGGRRGEGGINHLFIIWLDR